MSRSTSFALTPCITQGLRAANILSHRTAHICRFKLGISKTSRNQCKARWVCEDAHPYGNGGLLNICDYNGYNKEDFLSLFEKTKTEFESAVAGRTPTDETSIWTLIYNTDHVMVKNNLIEEGFQMDLQNVRVMKVVNYIAKRFFDNAVDHLWVLKSGDNESIVSVEHADTGILLLSWEYEDDVKRFALNLEADGRGSTTPYQMPLSDLRGMCENGKTFIGLVLPSFVQPSHFGVGLI